MIDAVRNHDEHLVERLWLCDTDLDRLSALRRVTDGVRLLQSTKLERIKEGSERRV